MATGYPFLMPQTIKNEVEKPFRPVWSLYRGGWNGCPPHPETQTLGLACIEDWAVTTEALIRCLDGLHELIDENAVGGKAAAQQLYGLAATLPRLMEDLYDLIDFSRASLPYDPVARRLVLETPAMDEAQDEQQDTPTVVALSEAGGAA